MNRWSLALAGLRQGWRRQLGLFFGSALATAVLVGALAVGDSVSASLRNLALQRIGRIDAVLQAGDRFFRADLGQRLSQATTGSDPLRVVSALRQRGLAATPDGSHRANGVTVLGVDRRFFELGLSGEPLDPPGRGEAYLNHRLASQLAVEVGDPFILRVEDPGDLPSGAALADQDRTSLALRLDVARILEPDQAAHFNLESHQVPPFNCFVDRDSLAIELGVEGRANLLAAAGDADPADLTERAQRELERALTLDDLELSLDVDDELAELTSRRVFLDQPVEEAVRGLDLPAVAGLTYFVNEIRAGERSTPYSTVTAAGALGETAALAPALDPGGIVPPRGSAGIVLNQWLADDLRVSSGDRVEMAWFVLGDDMRLSEQRRGFEVFAVVPLEGMAADPSWMPAFPGIEDSENCRDWEPGIPVDLDRIRDQDEQYWDDFGGTPKAWLALDTGQELFGSRFGGLTTVRVALEHADALEAGLLAAIDPASLGLLFRDIRTPAVSASRTATDFGGLFIGLSLFLMAAAILLTTLLFLFGVEQRSAEIGALLAMGFDHRLVRSLLLREAGVIALLGALPGIALGVLYTRLILSGLRTLWSDAVASAHLAFHAEPTSLIGGALGAVLAALLTLVLTLRKNVRRPATELLSARAGIRAGDETARAGRWSWIVLLVAAAAAIGMVLAARRVGGTQAAGLVFGAGAMALLATLAGSRLILARLARRGPVESLSIAALGRENSCRRPGRSLATIALLATGTFLVMAVGVNRLDPPDEVGTRTAGTGGFGLVARTSLPLLHDLESERGREAFGLLAEDLRDTAIVPLRQSPGDEASCLNLSLSSNPRLYGVDPAELAERRAFSFADPGDPEQDASPWTLLDRVHDDGALPVIGDAASVTWALHKGVGDTLDYVDERGRPFQVRIVATVSNSILQGMLLLGERHFRDRFPSESGHRLLLIDVPESRAATVAATLSRSLADVGLEVRASQDRLAEFNAVQNTYLTIFQVLGGLGVLLGSLGLGLVVLRNVLERRAELALCQAVGYPRAAIRRMLLGEHGLLLLLGLGAGLLSALVAMLPAGRETVSLTPLVLVLGVALSGLLWVVLATAFATRGSLVDALRSE